MAPSLRNVAVPAAPATALSVALLGVLGVLAGAPATAAGTSSPDPAHDVRAVSGTSNAKKNTVDITKVTYAVTDDRLIITTHLLDLRKTPGHEFVETEVRAGETMFTLSSQVGQRPVAVFTGPTLTLCEGATTSVSSSRDVVRQSVPLDCIDADRVRLRSSALLARDNGSRIARDTAASRTVALD